MVKICLGHFFLFHLFTLLSDIPLLDQLQIFSAEYVYVGIYSLKLNLIVAYCLTFASLLRWFLYSINLKVWVLQS